MKAKHSKAPAERVVKDIRRATRKQYSAEEKIRIMEAGKRRLAGDTARAANSDEVRDLRKEARDLKEVVAEQMLEMRLLKKSMIGDGGGEE